MSEKIVKHINLLSSLLDSGKPGYSKFRNSCIRPEDLDKNSGDCLRFIEEYYQKYGEPPTRTVFIHTFHEDLPQSSGSLEFWIDEVLKTKMTEHAHNAVQNFGIKWKEDIVGALAKLEADIKFVKNQKRGIEFLKARDLVDELRKKYFDSKAKIIGIPTPWETMNNWTQGWNPGDLCFLGARTGKGKTFFTILALLSAMKSGKVKKCLYASGEMPPLSILQRYAVIDHQVSYEKVRQGELGPFQEEKYLKYLDTTLRELETLTFFDRSKTDFTLTNMGEAIESSEADFVIVDAAYMMKLEKTLPSHESMGKIAQGLKDCALKYRVPIIATSQLNRASLQKQTNDDSDFALSDQIAWNSDFMFVMSQSDEQYKMREMQINPVKIREGVNTREGLRISWCFDRMDFTEIKPNVSKMSDYRGDPNPPPPPPPKPKKKDFDLDPSDPDHPAFYF